MPGSVAINVIATHACAVSYYAYNLPFCKAPPMQTCRVRATEALAGQPRELEGPRANICSDCFNRVFDCFIRVYRSFGAHKQNGAQGKMPQLPPLSAALGTCSYVS